MRGFSLGILMVLAVAAVLIFSLRGLSREKSRLLQGFADAQAATVRELASDFENRLQDVEEDARVIAALVQGARGQAQPDPEDSQGTMLASFRAMATVVRHYRSVALFGADGTLQVSATDPTESAATAQGLARLSRDAAGQAGRGHRLIGSFELPGKRHFYVYAVPAGTETIVLAIDGPRLLQSALRSVPEGRVIVADPAGTEWSGCGASGPCGPSGAPAAGAAPPPWHGRGGAAWMGDDAAARMGLPRANAVAAWASADNAALGSWRVVLVASAKALHAREQALIRQLLLTATGLVAAFGLVGILIVRQQRYSAALAERLRNAEVLRSLERQLIRAEKLATTGVLAAGIAHEVGTPLGIIRARAELLMDRMATDDVRRALDAIIQQIDRISSTIRQVLDFSRAQPVEMRPVEIPAAVSSTLELLEHRFRQQQITVRVDLQEGLPPVAADADQLQQVLINLLLNACDACDRGGGVWIHARRDGQADRVRWDIRDDGAGIPAEHLLAVFDPFFTTKKRGEGTGLGLPVAASIVRNHGGEIALSSVPGEGTTVSIFWPIAKERPDGER